MRIFNLLWLFVSVVQAPPPADLSLQTQTICNSYHELSLRVTQALRIQAGDISQIQRYQQSVQVFLTTVTAHQDLFDPLEYNTINTSVQNMATALEEASAKSEDIAEHTPLAPVEVIHTGQRGQPRKNIDRELLETSLRL
ncbi:hypothetical protein BDP27DRAFT_1432374 [Rhodocollybia butyracea]|uniref:Uncharacterized protein n=1 Tax=Rhodocollybia butyracea TaxID=206335 RepID=A0A9P5P9I7_9AGAR|nr:hypothetical protein BDP27DRAFT_1433999 [Rhodocollybia butyracea]KAF9058722.1 hypothetical protein BDP27DRAFT_1432374 [Rhodocollybia butyracea]